MIIHQRLQDRLGLAPAVTAHGLNPFFVPGFHGLSKPVLECQCRRQGALDVNGENLPVFSFEKVHADASFDSRDAPAGGATGPADRPPASRGSAVRSSTR
ncbi:MAG: hypothetical protein ACYCSF_01065 [Acidimicrobiales bacterium]